MDSTCTISGRNYVGLIGGSSGVGHITVSRVGNEAAVTASGLNAAGIIGCNKGSTSTFHIIDCYNTAGITGSSESAAICGWSGTNAVIQNCYNIGNVQGYNYRNDFYRGGGNVQNCYSNFGAQVTRISSDDVTSGKLCYQLNQGKVMDPVWYQTIGEDAYPVLDNTHRIVLKGDDGTYYNVTFLAGDVDGNGVVEENDAQWLAAYLTDNEPEGFKTVNADANLDGSIDVADVVTIRRLAGGTPQSETPLTATLFASNATVKAGGTRKVTVWANMSRAVTALEADIVLSEGLSVQQESIVFGTKLIPESHVAQVLPKDNGVHIIIYSAGNENLLANTGTALTFTLVGDTDFTGGTISIQDQCLVTADGVTCQDERLVHPAQSHGY